MSQPNQSASRVVKEPLLFWLKMLMLTGIALIVFGHYLWVGLQLPERMGVPGIIIVAGCCALGLILSLPTKIYLTILLMQYENAAAEQQAKAAATDPGNNIKIFFRLILIICTKNSQIADRKKAPVGAFLSFTVAGPINGCPIQKNVF